MHFKHIIMGKCCECSELYFIIVSTSESGFGLLATATGDTPATLRASDVV